jgi:rare lipoprotein A
VLMNISETEPTVGLGQCWVRRCFHTRITINAAQAEVVSVYGGSDGLCGSRTANGERVNCSAMTAAHRTLPFGTRVTVCRHGRVVVRINDRGPFVRGRHIDLTPAAARTIGLTEVGYVIHSTANLTDGPGYADT